MKKGKKADKNAPKEVVPKIPAFGNMDYYRQPETKN
jgi:hypothetical protein